MTAPARRQKPTSADETARVLRILDMLNEESTDTLRPPLRRLASLHFHPLRTLLSTPIT